MVQGSSAVGFGAFGLEVAGVDEVGGEVVVRVQSPAGRAVFCDGCGFRARSKGCREVVLRDAPFSGGRPQRVVWNKRVWACPNPLCAKGSWTERSGLAGPRRVLTGRAVSRAVGRLAAVEGSVASLACVNGCRSSLPGGSARSRWFAPAPTGGYRSAIRSLRGDRLRADAHIAVDPFHVVRLANKALDRCRRRTQNDTAGHRGRNSDPLYGARKLLLMGAERLDDTGWDRLRQALDAGDPYDEVADCWDG